MIKNSCIIYGSTTGNTEKVALKISEYFKTINIPIDIYDIAYPPNIKLKNYELYIIGTSTWYYGEMQSDWEYLGNKITELAHWDNSYLALFGCGDQLAYPEHFCSGLGKLYNNYLINTGTKLVGNLYLNNYNYKHSEAVIKNNISIGLMIDEDNQQELTDSRIISWSKKVITDIINLKNGDLIG